VLNVNTTIIHNTYIDRTVINNITVNHVSYNGGEGGITARPTPQEERVAQMRHVPPPAAQAQHMDAARSNPQFRASANQGKPPVAATARPGSFSGRDVVAAKEAGGQYRPAPAHPSETSGAEARPANPAHASELSPHQPATPPSTGNPNVDQKYQQQQAQLAAKQNQEHQQLAQKQQQEDQRAANAPAPRKQQVEQKHQQQTQQLEQRHTQQQQHLQTKQAPRPESKPR